MGAELCHSLGDGARAAGARGFAFPARAGSHALAGACEMETLSMEDAEKRRESTLRTNPMAWASQNCLLDSIFRDGRLTFEVNRDVISA